MSDNFPKLPSEVPEFKYKVPGDYATQKLFEAFKEEGAHIQMAGGIIQNPMLVTEQDIEDFNAMIESRILSLHALQKEVVEHIKANPAKPEDIAEYLQGDAGYQR